MFCTSCRILSNYVQEGIMVTSLWDKIEMYCALHEEPVKMELVSRKGQVFYECGLGNADKIAADATPCKGVLHLKDFEKMLDHISRVMYEAEMNNEIPNLKHMQFSIGKFKYKILDHNENIKILVRDIRIQK